MKTNEALSLIRTARAEIDVEISKSGLSCLWESGGGLSNTGTSRIICDRFGNAKKAIYVPTRGDLCNGGHALIPVTVDDIVVEDTRHRENHMISVWEITKIEDGKAFLRLLEYAENVKADTEQIYTDAITAAMEKARDYHCRSIYYAHY
jgi:hypothetical protein